MFSKNNTIIIVGRSEIVGAKYKYLLYFNELYPTIGINNINPEFQPTYTMFVDTKMGPIYNIINNNIDTTILTGLHNLNKIPTGIKTQWFKHVVIGSACTKPFDGDTLYFSGFTHDVAISYAIQQRYKNVILFGAADFTDIHYDNKTKFNRGEGISRQSINFIENVCSKFCNLYTINPNSRLNIGRISIERLLNEYEPE